jgi:hypothetical protein
MLRSNNTKETAMFPREAKICCVMIAAILVIAPAYADTEAVTINYGTVESVSTVEKDSKHAGGAMAGGMIAVIASGARA